MRHTPKQPQKTYRTEEWQCLSGKKVEVRIYGKLYRRGVVEVAMPDASGLWLAGDGVQSREFIDKVRGFEVWSDLYSIGTAPKFVDSQG